MLNADRVEHSFHIHGLDYGIDSDGAWPLGVQSAAGSRSDSICPGDSWVYVFDVSKEAVGVWPFHDHAPHASASIEKGLFGGLIVLPKPIKKCPGWVCEYPSIDDLRKSFRHISPRRRVRADALPRAAKQLHNDYLHWLEELIAGEIVEIKSEKLAHIPIFFHHMADPEGTPLFDSGDMEENGVGVFEHTFDDIGMFDYFCAINPEMTGTIDVTAAAADVDVTVNIEDVPDMGFYPALQQVRPGRKVTWINNSQDHHTVTSRQGATMPSHTINGRSFVGNTPTIVVDAGTTLRWYVFNLDLGHNWHNFHTHAMRWTFAGENIDVRSIGPAESFQLDTIAPDPLLLDRLPDDVAGTEQSAEIIDLSVAAPAWDEPPELTLNFPRAVQFTATLLPDGRVIVAGGITGADGGPVEIFDPQDQAAGWQVGPTMTHQRGYHSSFILLPDGSVLSGGDPKTGGVANEHERYFPGYYFRPRPEITAAPAAVAYGATFNVDCPTAGTVSRRSW